MRPSWVRWMTAGETILLAALYLSFFGIVTWRNRRNKFLFFAELSVLVTSTLLYLSVLVFELKAPR
jgi:hypothetical protein